MRKKKSQLFNEFAVLGVFVIVAFAGLIVGAVSIVTQAQEARNPEPVATAPSASEYRSQARAVFEPFLTQVRIIGEGTLPTGAGAVMSNLVDLTQERLLGMTVPTTERDAHLSMVILLDQWRRAIEGTQTDLAGVVSRTDSLLEDYPWIASL